MKTIRLALSAISVLLLLAGYLASQWAACTGNAPSYAEKVDQAPIVMLSLVILISAIVLAFIPEREET